MIFKFTSSYQPKRLAGPSGSPPSCGEPGARRRAILGDILYYLGLVAFVLAVFLFRGTGDGPPARVLGFSAMRVLTTSMGDELPQGALIITYETPPEDLKIGDDVTYLAGENTTVTHRIVGITEDYMGSGQPAFTTQGVANNSPDSRPVPAQNVVGKVIFCSLFLGKVLTFLRQYWPWLLILAVLLAGLCASLRVVIQESRRERSAASASQTAPTVRTDQTDPTLDLLIFPTNQPSDPPTEGRDAP